MLVHDLLTAAAHARPDRAAVLDRERVLTYAELEGRANRLARLLREHGVSRGDRVGLYLDKSLESVVGLYAAMKAGAAYVPLDPQSPVARLGYIARNAGLRCLLTGMDRAGEWEGLLAAGAPCETLVVLGAEAADLPDAALPARLLPGSAADGHDAGSPPDAGVQESDLAYILYTSGSTGEPKGVMLSHRNARAFVDWAQAEFAVSAADRLSSHAPLHFDLSTFDLFAAAGAGASVTLVPSELSIFPIRLARFIAEREISVWYSVPSILTMLVLRGKLETTPLPRLRTILFAGEVFPPKHLAQLMRLLGDVAFANLYGPTETNVCTYYHVPPLPDPAPQSIPIGRAIADVDVFAVGEDGRVVAPGETGELCVSGPTVMRGYWGDEERSARALRPVEGRGPAYWTGDLVRQDAAGDFHYLGRRDGQIKRLGYRIELGEIESAIDMHPGVVESAVVATPDERLTSRITAYVVVSDVAVDEVALTAACRERIPRYMVPDAFELRATLPKTSTGKIDRRSLAAG